MKELGLINGRIVDLQEKFISIEDRGYQFGDGIYEVTAVFNGKFFMLEEHLNRLFSSGEKIKLNIPFSKDEIEGFHRLLLKESGLDNANIYIQITRGSAKRTHAFPAEAEAVLTMSIRGRDDSKVPVTDRGVEAILTEDIRWLRCDIKSLNLLANVLAKQEAYEAGKGEAIMHRNGIMTEGSSTNFYVVKDGIVHTHPANNLILNGITRIALLRLCKDHGIQVIEEPFNTQFMYNAHEAFITGTTTRVTPILKVNDTVIGDGVRGPVTKKLQELFKDLIDNL